MAIAEELYPSQEDLLYEEELLRNQFSLKLWWRYLIARSDSPFKKRFLIYEASPQALPGSYKLWYAYLRERLEIVRNLPIKHSQYETLNNTFERALVTMHKMPRIWIMYLQTLTDQELLTRTRRTFDRALCALPVTQHDRIWEPYLVFVSKKGVPIETSLRVYRRYLKYDPTHIEDFIEFLMNSGLWQEAAERLAGVLNDDQFIRSRERPRHRKFTDEVGRLWTSLADYYIRRNLTEKARDIFEEGMTTVVTVRDFSVIFDAYSQFEESMLAYKMENMDSDEEEDDVQDNDTDEEEDIRLDINLSVANFEKKILHGFWLHDFNDVDLRLARLEHLMDRRPELANSVLLRQNPHNVEQWHRRIKLFEGNPTKQILTYTEAVRTVDPMKAVGKPHTLWVALLSYMRTTKMLPMPEMELRHKNFKGALELMRRATAEPSVEVKRKDLFIISTTTIDTYMVAMIKYSNIH
ncbi:Pre-mRNA-splicing factor SYF1 [Vitis vinifera]|uniref:Pre-mRNA-splicing factor SYF1 n=1 Tax=Vitis vinifera TaxID=29760 RepID=A0A438JI40_VITVI|nr:Pre-mRNA-splicing factor SYF1 [Vitis vinifera]